MADKVLVKQFVAEACGTDVVIPTLWHGIELPDDAATRFTAPIMLKSNHASGTNLLIPDPAGADWATIRAIAGGWLQSRYNPYAREAWYGRIERQLLVEPFVGSNGAAPPDYKFFVFSGTVRCIQVDLDRFTGHKRALYDRDWRRLPVSLAYPSPDGETPAPRHLDAMLAIAERLGRKFSFVRVDLYDLPQGPKFGEMTFAPGGGVEAFSPASFDYELGEFWVGDPAT